MKIGDEEYMKVRDAFMREEFNKDPQKPNTLIGDLGWFRKKELELLEKLREEKKLDEEI